VFQAAALDRSGSVKGGPYSGSAKPNGKRDGQFGMLHIKDDGSKIDVTFQGLDHDGAVLMEHRFSRP